MTISRREMLKISAGSGAALLLNQVPAFAQQPQLMRAIPSTGELIPAVGLGSARTFSVGPPSMEWVQLSDVLELRRERRVPLTREREISDRRPLLPCWAAVSIQRWVCAATRCKRGWLQPRQEVEGKCGR